MRAPIVVVAVFAVLLANLAVASDPLDVHYDAAGRLTVRAHGVAPADFLAAVAAETGATIRHPTFDASPIEVTFEHIPLEEALGRVFPGASVLVRYGRGTEVRSIQLLGSGRAVSAPEPAAQPADAVPEVTAAAEAPVSPRPEDEEWSPSEDTPPPSAREMVARVLGSEELRRLALQRVRAMGPRAALTALRSWAGVESEGVLRDLADDAGLGRVSRAAARALSRLQ